jgi:hypothetical protein
MDPLHEPAVVDKVTKGCKKIFKGIIGNKYREVLGPKYAYDHTIPKKSEIEVQVRTPEDGSLTVNVIATKTLSKVDYPGSNPGSNHSYTNDLSVASFSIRPMDGGFSVIFAECRVNGALRNRGYGVKLHKLRLKAAKLSGASSVVATCNATNQPQIRIFKHFNWKQGTLDESHFIFYRSLADIEVK